MGIYKVLLKINYQNCLKKNCLVLQVCINLYEIKEGGCKNDCIYLKYYMYWYIFFYYKLFYDIN